MRGRRLAALGVAAGLLGCSSDDGPAVAVWRGPIEARCEAEVVGTGIVDIEQTYLPAVIACENGAADFEALKAQAVSARSYLYYRLETGGSIRDGTSDQVFSCPRPPRDIHRQAVAETAGEVLTWRGNVIAAFYVAGAIPEPPTCVATPADNDPTNTERFVTYNAGRVGGDNEPTPLGHPQSPRNRGCKSQNGAHCLAEAGWGYADILRFYYGDDIGLERAVGDCVEPEPEPEPEPMPCPPVAADGETVLDEADARCFTHACESGDWWRDHETGVGDTSLSTGTIERAEPDCVGAWHLQFAAAGDYTVWVHIPEVAEARTRQARYLVRHAGETTPVALDQRVAGWHALGTFAFEAGADQGVTLPDNTGEPYRDDGIRLVYDAVRVAPAAASPVDAGPRPDAGDPPDAAPRPDAASPPPDAGRPDPERPDAALPVDLGPSRDAGLGLDGGLSGLTPGTSRQSGGCVAAGPAPLVGWLLLVLGLGISRRRR